VLKEFDGWYYDLLDLHNRKYLLIENTMIASENKSTTNIEKDFS
jgi:hypothetical protein